MTKVLAHHLVMVYMRWGCKWTPPYSILKWMTFPMIKQDISMPVLIIQDS